MCLLLVASPNSTPKKKDLECASCNNPHGFGYAVIAGDKIISGRGMSAKKVIREFLAVRKEFPNSYAMYHARLATHGVKNEENCHPFKVGGDSRTYLAHNGILDVDIHATDKRSDTRIFAEDILPNFGGVKGLDNDNTWIILSKWAVGSKIAVLTVDPNANDSCYIINEKSGCWDNDGIWWSNDSYKPSQWSNYWGGDISKESSVYPYSSVVPYNTADSTSRIEDAHTEFECPSCLGIAFENANPYWCEFCNTCFDCSGTFNDTCLCWTPENKRYAYSGKEGIGYYNGHFDF